MSSTQPTVAVLANSKKSQRVWSAYIARALNRVGIPAYRVTPNAVPRFRPENFKMVINYGVSTLPTWWHRLPEDCVVFNHPDQVKVSVDKIAMCNTFADIHPDKILPFTTQKAQAQAWIDEGGVAVARTLISSHSGKGIVISPPQPLPDARLYTKLTRRRGLREYRVFIYNHTKVEVVQKKRMTKAKLVADGFCTAERAETWWSDIYNKYIRAWKHGWAFCHQDLDVPKTDPVFDEIAAETGKLLRWGVIDVLVDTRTKQWYLIEINSAPSLDAGNTQKMFISLMKETAVDDAGVELVYNFKEV